MGVVGWLSHIEDLAERMGEVLIADALIVVYAILLGAALWLAIRAIYAAAVLAHPALDKNIRRTFAWHVKFMFSTARWYGLSQKSVRYCIACKWALPAFVSLAFAIPALTLACVISAGLMFLTLSALAWQSAGPKVSGVRFARSFVAPVVYAISLAAVLGVFNIVKTAVAEVSHSPTAQKSTALARPVEK